MRARIFQTGAPASLVSAALLAGFVLVCLVAGCSRGTDEAAAVPATEETGGATGSTGNAEVEELSNAARARGLPVEQEEADDEERPVITIGKLEYRWMVQPSKALEVAVTLGTANEVFGRARAYVFIVAEYSNRRGVNRGVFPSGAELGTDSPFDCTPFDYTDGSHVTYRRSERVECTIPYGFGEGYYDSIRVMVYSEEGELLLDQPYALEVTGEPTGQKETRPVLAL